MIKSPILSIRDSMTDDQKELFDSAKYLFSDGPRATGRSYVMAGVFLSIAWERFGQEIPCIDHHLRECSNVHFKRMLQGVFEKHFDVERFKLKINLSSGSIVKISITSKIDYFDISYCPKGGFE